jgi:pyrroline-5-carboxylate reductase
MPHTRAALHLSVAAGIRTDSIARWVGTDRVVRCMPNTPALVGQGITGLFACPSVTPQDQTLVEQVIGTTGQFIWVQQESQLDAVTALSGSGPAYVFLFLEAMIEAGAQMGLTREQAKRQGYVETVFGRRLWLAEINSPNGPRRAAFRAGRGSECQAA